MSGPTVWHGIERNLARLRPQRQPLSLLLDVIAICLCWNFTYLFRLGFERWWVARPSYDPWVMLGVAALYAVVFVIAQIPRGMWRFSGFSEIKRLAIACTIAGSLSAAAVLMLQLGAVPRAVLALHPIITLMGLCSVRLGYRALYEHVRARITGSDAEVFVYQVGGEARGRPLAGSWCALPAC